jgi:RNA polymerase sigma-70 factor (ECF subfamily)
MQFELEPKHVQIITSEAAAAARRLQRKLGSPVCEQEDLAQDLLVDLLRRLPAFDPAKGSLGAFSGLILRNQASRIAMKIMRERRAVGGATVSLDAPAGEDDPRPLVEAISDTQGLAAWHGQNLSEAEKQQGRISIETALAQLPHCGQRLCAALSANSVNTLCKGGFGSRSAIYRRIAELRVVLTAYGLGASWDDLAAA